MSVLLTKISLIYLVATTPVVHLQLIDGGYSDLETCQKVISAIAQQEKSEPEDERIAQSLRCYRLSMRYDPDGDGPKKPVSPKGTNPMLNNGRDESFLCQSVVCRNTSLPTQ